MLVFGRIFGVIISLVFITYYISMILYVIIACIALFIKHTMYKVVLYKIYTLLKYAIKAQLSQEKYWGII